MFKDPEIMEMRGLMVPLSKSKSYKLRMDRSDTSELLSISSYIYHTNCPKIKNDRLIHLPLKSPYGALSCLWIILRATDMSNVILHGVGVGMLMGGTKMFLGDLKDSKI